MDVYWGAIGTILAALIAALAAWFASVLAKENRISEFRQSWIDALRDDCSEFASLAMYMGSEVQSGLDAAMTAIENSLPELLETAKQNPAQAHRDLKKLNLEAHQDRMRELQPEYLRINQLKTRIQMRLNPRNHSALLEALKEVNPLTFDGLEDRVHAFVEQGQKTFGVEWTRVKKGEDVYVSTVLWAKRGAVTAAALGVCFILLAGVARFLDTRGSYPAESTAGASASSRQG